jgi:hypothetical protein
MPPARPPSQPAALARRHRAQVLPVVFNQQSRLMEEADAWPHILVNTTEDIGLASYSITDAFDGFMLTSSVGSIDPISGLLRLSTTVTAVGRYQDSFSPFSVSLEPNTSLIITVGGELPRAGVRARRRLQAAQPRTCASLLPHAQLQATRNKGPAGLWVPVQPNLRTYLAACSDAGMQPGHPPRIAWCAGTTVTYIDGSVLDIITSSIILEPGSGLQGQSYASYPFDTYACE